MKKPSQSNHPRIDRQPLTGEVKQSGAENTSMPKILLNFFRDQTTDCLTSKDIQMLAGRWVLKDQFRIQHALVGEATVGFLGNNW